MKSIVRQLLEGARFLHEQGILHRDLKPSNIIVALSPTASSPREEDVTAGTARAGGGDRSGVESPESSSPYHPERHVSSGEGIDVSPGDPAETGGNAPVAPAGGGGVGRGRGVGRKKRRRRKGGGGGGGHGRDKGGDGGRELPVLLKVADFSSAVDKGAIAAGLYGSTGPTQDEETLLYAPPEVLFDPEVKE